MSPKHISRISSLPKIFICYAKKDFNKAYSIYKRLNKHGFDAWIDQHKLFIGDPYQIKIKQAVMDADAFVVCLRPEFNQKGFRQNELSWAEEALRERPRERGFIIPYIIEPIEPHDLPYLCRNYHAGRDISKLTTFVELLEALREHCGKSFLGLRSPEIIVQEYLRQLSKKEPKKNSWGYDIFSLPIVLRPIDLSFTGIKSLSEVKTNRLLIHGKPACGKSTTVKRIINTAARQKEFIPIRLKVNDIRDSLEFEKETCKELSITKKDFIKLERAGRLIYIFDGLNEHTNIKELAGKFKERSNEFSNSRFLITCRSYEYESEAKDCLEGFTPLEIGPLSWKDQKTYIEKDKYVPGELQRTKLLTALEHDLVLQDICSNQFIFLMAVKYIPEEKAPPRISSDFYELFLKRFLNLWERSRAKRNKDFGVEKKRKFLEELAFEMIACGPSKTWINETTLGVLMRHVKGLEKSDPQRLLDKLFEHGLLEKGHSGIKFFQETFQEFLIASRLKRKGIFPIDLARNAKGLLEYCAVEISQQSEKFYLT